MLYPNVICMKGTVMDELEGLCVKFFCVYVQIYTRGSVSVSMVVYEHMQMCVHMGKYERVWVSCVCYYLTCLTVYSCCSANSR